MNFASQHEFFDNVEGTFLFWPMPNSTTLSRRFLHAVRPAIAAAAGFSIAACSDKPQPPPAPVVAPPAVSAPASGSGAADAKSTATHQSHVPSGAAASKALERDVASPNPEIYLKTLTDLLNAWVMAKNDFPASLDELVKARMIAKLPTPPPGKRLAIDKQGCRVVLVDQ